MLAGKLRNMLKWGGEGKTIEAIIIEVRGITTAPTIPLQLGNEPLKEPCSYLLITSEEVVRAVDYERGSGYPLPPPRGLPSPGDKAYNIRIILNCFWDVPRSEGLIKSIRDLLGELTNALRPREVFAKIVYAGGGVEYVGP